MKKAKRMKRAPKVKRPRGRPVVDDHLRAKRRTVSVADVIWDQISDEAERRGITVSGLLRALWLAR